MIRYTLLELNCASTFVPTSLDQALAASTSFALQLTQIINRTAPLNSDGLATYSAIWSSAFNVNADEIFSTETRYSFFQRTSTNIAVTIEESLFYVSNQQRPIARQKEIIFRSLLFTTVVLELFGLIFIILKLLLFPLLHIVHQRLQSVSKRNQVTPVQDQGNVMMTDEVIFSPVSRSASKMKYQRKRLSFASRAKPTWK